MNRNAPQSGGVLAGASKGEVDSREEGARVFPLFQWDKMALEQVGRLGRGGGISIYLSIKYLIK